MDQRDVSWKKERGERPAGCYSNPPVYLLEIHHKYSSLSFRRLHLYITLMQHKDLFAEAEPDSTPVFAGAEERNEDLVEQVIRNPRTIISYLKADPGVGGSTR